MADLTFSPWQPSPMASAIQAEENFGTLPAPTFKPAIALIDPSGVASDVEGPALEAVGPGAVAGLGPGAVVRMDPPPGAGDVEPNFCAAIELMPPELPWLLTPARPVRGRLRPWIVLVVVEASTPIEHGQVTVLEVTAAQLPNLADSWGWAHVQTSGAGRIARLLCPRRLAPNTSYRACVVPAFASGVAAALEERDVLAAPHAPAWLPGTPGSFRLPVYHHWTFATGAQGDFESLVRRLGPADPAALAAIGARTVDVSQPWRHDLPLTDDAAPQQISVLGALAPLVEPPPPPRPITPEAAEQLGTRLTEQLNAPADRLDAAELAAGAVGAIAPPLYGAGHRNQHRVETADEWIRQVNLDPGQRIAAGLGADYVRTNQEKLMAAAWEQVGAIREANRLRARAELSADVAESLHRRHVATLETGELVGLAAPAAERARVGAGTTLALEVGVSPLPDAAASSAFARFLRPSGPIALRSEARLKTVVPRGLDGEITVSNPQPLVSAVATPTSGGGTLAQAAAQASTARALAREVVFVAAAATVGSAHGVAATARLGELVAAMPLDEGATLAMLAGDVKTLSARIADRVEGVSRVIADSASEMPAMAAGDSELTELGLRVNSLRLRDRLIDTMQPRTAIVRRLTTRVNVSPEVEAGALEPVMAYPTFPLPTALALVDADPEWFVPGIGSFPANQVALLEPNPVFIESYLVGANHEMMRELRWREYPTDLRGTPFARFWPRADGADDIPPIHTWRDTGGEGMPLGGHLTLSEGDVAVVLVRGDVLRRFPDVVVTAIRSGEPDGEGHLRPDPAQPHVDPLFVVRVDAATNAYAFPIPREELTGPPVAGARGWFFVFQEHGYRIRFGFDDPPPPDQLIGFLTWSDLTWPADPPNNVGEVPFDRGHAIAGAPLAPPFPIAPGDPLVPVWDNDAADVARIALQLPFRLAVHAHRLLGGAGE